MAKNECVKCGKLFTTTSGLKSHLNRKTPCDQILNCNICNKTFKLQGSYDKHKLSCKPVAKNIIKKTVAKLTQKIEPIEQKPIEQKLIEQKPIEQKSAEIELAQTLHELENQLQVSEVSVLNKSADLYDIYIQRAISNALNNSELEIVDQLIERLFKSSLLYVVSKHKKINNLEASSFNVSLNFSEDKSIKQ